MVLWGLLLLGVLNGAAALSHTVSSSSSNVLSPVVVNDSHDSSLASFSTLSKKSNGPKNASNTNDENEKSSCSATAPRFYSQKALSSAKFTLQCSRECVAYRSKIKNFTPSKTMKGSKTMMLVVAHWKENLEWLSKQPLCYMVMEKVGNGYDADSDPSLVVLNKGNEASSYLTFIVDNYKKLPDNVAFVHGDQVSEHAVDLVPMLSTINPDGYGYASLNGITFPMMDLNNQCVTSAYYQYVIEKNGYGDIFPPLPRSFLDIRYTCCAQFIVSKKRILSRPLDLYEKLFNFTVSANDTGHGTPINKVNGKSTWTGYNFLSTKPSIKKVLNTENSTPVNSVNGSTESSIKKRDLERMIMNGTGGLLRTRHWCQALNMTLMTSFSRGAALELTWHVIFGDQWKSSSLDPVLLCGSEERCPQDLPVVSKNYSDGVPHGVVRNQRDPFWYPALAYEAAVRRQGIGMFGETLTLLTTPDYSKQLDLMEEASESPLPPSLLVSQPRFHLSETSHQNDISVHNMEDERIRWFSDLVVNRTAWNLEYVTVLLLNDNSCGVDFFGLRAQPYITFRGCETPIRIYTSRHKKHAYMYDVVISSGEVPKFKRDGQIHAWCSMEQGAEISNSSNIDVTITPEPHSSLPISFYSHFYLGEKAVRSVLREPSPLAHDLKIPKIVIAYDDCTNFCCEDWVNAFQNAMPENIDSIGACWTTKEATIPMIKTLRKGDYPMAYHANLRANIRPYMFTLCHDSTSDQGWITERVYQALAVGSVPVYRGSPDIENYLPCKNCIVNANQFESPAALASYLQELMDDRDRYEELLAWKKEAYEPTDFPEFEFYTRATSVDTSFCRLASMVPKNAFHYSPRSSCDGECLNEVYRLQRYAP